MRQISIRCNEELVKSKLRIDGRKCNQHRSLSISFGVDFGCCLVSLGNTKVLVQVTTTIDEPRVTRPSEGVLNFRVDCSMLGSSGADTGRSSEEHVELSRLLHKNIKDSTCLDLESLCIIGGEKVWHLMIDVTVLNHEGNLIEVASIATLAALNHHRMPDVTIEHGKLIIHPLHQREPQRLIIKHSPFLMKSVFFKEGQEACNDPIEDEEKFCDGYLIVGSNEFKEITCMHISGKSLISKEQIIKQCNYAIKFTKMLNRILKTALTQDEEERKLAAINNVMYKGDMFETLASIC